MCRAAARAVARLDRNQELAFLANNHPDAEPFMAAIPKEDFANSYQIILPDGQRLMFGRASVKLLETFPATRWLGRAARVLHLYWPAGGVYRFISWLRPHLGRFVKDAPGPHRWP